MEYFVWFRDVGVVDVVDVVDVDAVDAVVNKLARQLLIY
jgi:hypothetical protein